MAKAQKTTLRVVKGTVGGHPRSYEVGETFVAEEIGADADRLVKLGVCEVVSQAIAPVPDTGGYSTPEREELDQQIADAIDAVGYAAQKLGISPQIASLADIPAALQAVDDYVAERNTLAEREQATSDRSKEIADEMVATRAHLTRAFGLLGAPADDTLGTANLAMALADAVVTYVEKKHAEILADAARQQAAQNPAASETPS